MRLLNVLYFPRYLDVSENGIMYQIFGVRQVSRSICSETHVERVHGWARLSQFSCAQNLQPQFSCTCVREPFLSFQSPEKKFHYYCFVSINRWIGKRQCSWRFRWCVGNVNATDASIRRLQNCKTDGAEADWSICIIYTAKYIIPSLSRFAWLISAIDNLWLWKWWRSGSSFCALLWWRLKRLIIM